MFSVVCIKVHEDLWDTCLSLNYFYFQTWEYLFSFKEDLDQLCNYILSCKLKVVSVWFFFQILASRSLKFMNFHCCTQHGELVTVIHTWLLGPSSGGQTHPWVVPLGTPHPNICQAPSISKQHKTLLLKAFQSKFYMKRFFNSCRIWIFYQIYKKLYFIVLRNGQRKKIKNIMLGNVLVPRMDKNEINGLGYEQWHLGIKVKNVKTWWKSKYS
jgi:hypothetical protein